MAFRDTANFTRVAAITGPDNVGEVYARLKDALVAAGWTVTKSGDGTNYNSSGDAIGTYAEMNTALAWYVVRAPGAVMGHTTEICIQRIGTGLSSAGRLKISPSAGFSGGSPSATQVPSATDEQVNCGGGTDASPTGAGLFGNMTTQVELVIGADTASPYGFYAFTRQEGTPYTCLGTLLFDPLDSSGANPVAADDDWPFVLYSGDGTTGTPYVTTVMDNSTIRMGTYWGLGSASVSWEQPIYLGYLGVQRFAPLASGSGVDDDWNSKTQLITPATYGKSGAGPHSGMRGISTLVSLMARLDSEVNQRVVLDHPDAAKGDGYWIKVGDVAFPWDGSLPSSYANHDVAPWELNYQTPAAVDSTAPVISNLIPADGAALERDTIIQLDVTDETGFGLVAIFASFTLADGSERVEMVYDGDAFRGKYTTAANTKTAITDGFRFTIRRSDGWDYAPTFEYLVLDTSANLGEV